MKRWLLLTALILGLAASPAAAVVNVQESGVDQGDAVHLNFSENFDVTGDYSTKEVAFSSTDASRIITWAPDEFMLATHPTDNAGECRRYTALSTSTTPGFEITTSGTTHVTGFISWSDGEDSPVQKKFRVPADYRSGGAFRVLVGRNNTDAGNNPPAIDYAVYVDQTNTALDTTATNQTASALSAANSDGSPEEKTLSVSTDFASLAAGDYVTVEFWRDDVNTSTDDLRLYYAEFYYSANE